MSFPVARDIATISLSPSLASQAPNVRRIIARAVFGACATASVNGTNNTNLRVIPSRDRRTMRKWDWFRSIFIIANNGRIDIRVSEELFIELREVPIFDLQDHCLIISFQLLQIALVAIIDTQGQYFC